MKCPTCGHDPNALTPREVDVLRGLVAGQANKAIARDLGIETVTVKGHVEHLIGKLGVANRTAAAVKAIREGMV